MIYLYYANVKDYGELFKLDRTSDSIKFNFVLPDCDDCELINKVLFPKDSTKEYRILTNSHLLRMNPNNKFDRIYLYVDGDWIMSEEKRASADKPSLIYNLDVPNIPTVNFTKEEWYLKLLGQIQDDLKAYSIDIRFISNYTFPSIEHEDVEIKSGNIFQKETK